MLLKLLHQTWAHTLYINEAMLEPGEDDKGEDYGIDDVDDVYFKERANSCASQLTQSDLSRLGMLTAIGDPGKVHH